ncbi:MAG: ABC transporter substrate-binding protein [Firmicutes bacterium]|nr:ABC transporter substrate-binding protein [Bacillota bacterium]
MEAKAMKGFQIMNGLGRAVTLLITGLLIIWLSVAAVPVTAAKKASEQKPVKIRYAAFIGMTGLGFWLGKEKGFFEEAGLNLEMVEVGDKVSAFAAGEIDFADLATTNAIIGAGRGAPLKIVASMFRTKGPFYLLARPEIKRVEDLRGKKVGVGAIGSGMDVYTRVILKKHGLDPERDVILINNGVYQQAMASLEAGQVAATIIHEPFVSLAERKGTGRLLARGWDYLPTFHTGVLVASDAFIKKHPDLVRKLIATYFKSNIYAKSHPDELLDFGTRYLRVDRGVLKAALDRERVIWENNPDVDLNALEDTQKIQIDLGFQDRRFDVGKILDLRFIPR